MTRTWNWTRTATGKVLLGLALALIVMVGARTALDRTLTTAIRNEAVEHASHIA